jgi:hypothetical protein
MNGIKQRLDKLEKSIAPRERLHFLFQRYEDESTEEMLAREGIVPGPNDTLYIMKHFGPPKTRAEYDALCAQGWIEVDNGHGGMARLPFTPR